jgi:acyl-CoA thioesterase FadM
MDELMSIVNFEYADSPVFTAFLKLDFLTPIFAPCELLIDTWIDSVSGRKRVTRGTVSLVTSDGGRVVCAEGNALFVEWGPKEVEEWRKQRNLLLATAKL